MAGSYMLQLVDRKRMSGSRAPLVGQGEQGQEPHGEAERGGEGVAVLLYIPRGDLFMFYLQLTIFIYFCDHIYLRIHSLSCPLLSKISSTLSRVTSINVETLTEKSIYYKKPQNRGYWPRVPEVLAISR